MLPIFTDPSKRRVAIGGIALVLLVTAVAIWPFRRHLGPMEWELQAACLRIGILMGIVWAAYDQLRRVPVWLWWSFPAVVLVLALRPRWLPFLVPILLALALLRPRGRR